MASQSEPDDFCPACGVPVPFHRRGVACPYCGHEFDAPLEGPHVSGYLTPFGYGLCGFIAGGQIGAAVALVTQDLELGDPRLTLFPASGALLFAGIMAWIGSRLHTAVKRGFEAFLFALIVAGVLVFMLALGGVSSVDALGATGLCTLVVATPVVWRLLYTRGRGADTPR